MIKKSFLIVQEIIIYAILTLRVYALFNLHQVILMLLSVVGLGSLAIGMWLGTTTDTTGVAGAWEAGLFRDVHIFGFTLLRGILHWRRADHSPCVDCFVIDGFIYVLLLTNDLLRPSSAMYVPWSIIGQLLNRGKPFLAGSLAWLASALSAVLIARLMLNMREVVDTGVYGTDIGAICWLLGAVTRPAAVLRALHELQGLGFKGNGAAVLALNGAGLVPSAIDALKTGRIQSRSNMYPRGMKPVWIPYLSGAFHGEDDMMTESISSSVGASSTGSAWGILQTCHRKQTKNLACPPEAEVHQEA
ncbi:hypothetical protein B0H14DRAFT_2579652 [Mycena olivaceomarginata]|nr:hypothetical protein B0H14DRAFT_2579652 [Mycena olivaceomarginata]